MISRCHILTKTHKGRLPRRLPEGCPKGCPQAQGCPQGYAQTKETEVLIFFFILLLFIIFIWLLIFFRLFGSSSSDSSSGSSSSSSTSAPKKKAKPQTTRRASTPSRSKRERSSKSSKRSSHSQKDNVKDYKVSPTPPEPLWTPPPDDSGKKKRATTLELPIRKWWLEDPLPAGKKWVTFKHNGPIFPDPYIPHKVPLVYDGKDIPLKPEQEEIATWYAALLHSDHVHKDKFNSNFFKQYKPILHKTPEGKVVEDFKKLDFRKIRAFLDARKEKKLARSKEERDEEKIANLKLQMIHGIALVDGFPEKVANWKIEPPGLFLGRGAHPKTGTFKARVQPEDVIINIGKGELVPRPPEGHHWGGVRHDDEASWLFMFRENVMDGFKYGWLAPSARVKGVSDRNKFDKARRLHQLIDKIRAEYRRSFTSSDRKERQLATAIYLIDFLALRVGNEKNEDEADTVGCCSLRIEHIKLEEENKVTFDFLGKDSMRYFQTVELDSGAWKNIKSFRKTSRGSPKQVTDDLFDEVSVSDLNDYLKHFMKDLSAKVFRTYNASITLERELRKDLDRIRALKTPEAKLLEYNSANRTVSILCNHQRTIPKAHNAQMEKLEEQLAELNQQLDLLKAQMKYLKGTEKKPPKVPKPEGEDKKPFKLPTSKEACKKQMSSLTEKIDKFTARKQDKGNNATVALGTAKINYMDPRITAAWCKEVDLDIGRIFAKTLRLKFPWAMDVSVNWRFVDMKTDSLRDPEDETKVKKEVKKEVKREVKRESKPKKEGNGRSPAKAKAKPVPRKRVKKESSSESSSSYSSIDDDRPSGKRTASSARPVPAPKRVKQEEPAGNDKAPAKAKSAPRKRAKKESNSEPSSPYSSIDDDRPSGKRAASDLPAPAPKRVKQEEPAENHEAPAKTDAKVKEDDSDDLPLSRKPASS
jgi:DNA topoisomerase-1